MAAELQLKGINMKKIFAAIALTAAIALPLGGCSTTAEPAPTVTVTAPAPEQYQPETSSVDDKYLNAVRSRSAGHYAVDDATLLDLAQTICEGLRAGIPIGTVLEIGVNSGLDQTSVAAIAAGAVVFYCPGADGL